MASKPRTQQFSKTGKQCHVGGLIGFKWWTAYLQGFQGESYCTSTRERWQRLFDAVCNPWQSGDDPISAANFCKSSCRLSQCFKRPSPLSRGAPEAIAPVLRRSWTLETFTRSNLPVLHFLLAGSLEWMCPIEDTSIPIVARQSPFP